MEAENRHNDSETRNRIIEMAGELFPQYGIKSVSMDEIARRLGMSKRTLYEYFADKEDLLIACMDQHHALMLSWAEELGSKAETVLHVFLEMHREMARKWGRTSPKFHEDLYKYPKAMALMAGKRTQMLETLLCFFETGVGQGIFLPQLNYDILSRTMIQMMDEPISQELTRRYSMTEIHNSLILPLVRGTCTETGLRIFEDYFAEYKD